MKRVVLYRVVDRELVFDSWIEIPEGVHDDTWLHDNGYDASYTIRTGIVRPMVTKAEAAIIDRTVSRLKAEGKLPSALDTILANVEQRAHRG